MSHSGRDVPQHLGRAGPSVPLLAAEVVDERPDAFVARPLQSEPLRFGSNAPVDLGDRYRLVIEATDGRDQAAGKAGRGEGDTAALPLNDHRRVPTLQRSKYHIVTWGCGGSGMLAGEFQPRRTVAAGKA